MVYLRGVGEILHGAHARQLRLARNGVLPGREELRVLQGMKKPFLDANTPFFPLLDGYILDSLTGLVWLALAAMRKKRKPC